MVQTTMLSINDVKLNPNNPRVIKDDKFRKLVRSIREFPQMLEIRPIVVNDDMIILGGNMRLKACRDAGLKEIPVIKVSDLTEDQQREFIIKDNVGYGEWDFEQLNLEWDVTKLQDWGLDLPEFDLPAEDSQVVAHQKLSDIYIVPPFSVLNARDGEWQDRKKTWKDLIGDVGQAREHVEAYSNQNWEGKEYGGEGLSNVSILDPVLSEVITRWFALPECKIFDCFAGDTVFGYVSSYLGNTFTGIELRQEQVDFNNNRLRGMNATYKCDDGRNVLSHIEEKSQDLLFSCPPYYDLEVYSELDNDASNQESYEDFLQILDTAFGNAIQCLKDNRFAVIVCGDIRDKKGNYYRFPDHIKEMFVKKGMSLYNELVLVDPVGNLQLRVGQYMKNRKIGKCHQNVLVFYKGDPQQIKHIYPKLGQYESTDV
jgi:DNA modification methylase